MVSTNETKISKAPSGNKLIVTRSFDAPVEKVWRAWTESRLLDDWWAPKPWKTETKSMQLKEGGQWLYSMVGPAGERHWSKVDFKTVVPQKKLASVCVFCDENGNTAAGTFPMYWLVEFRSQDAGTAITVELTFDNEADLEKIVAMGFKEGFTMGLGNLEELLAQGGV
jgi:uncharacterized protein YndB with AHSA1/START domain